MVMLSSIVSFTGAVSLLCKVFWAKRNALSFVTHLKLHRWYWWWTVVAAALSSLCTTSLFFFQWLSLACDFTCLFCKVPWVWVSRSFSTPDEHRLRGQSVNRGPLRWRWVCGAFPESVMCRSVSIVVQTPKIFFFLSSRIAWSAWHSRYVKGRCSFVFMSSKLAVNFSLCYLCCGFHSIQVICWRAPSLLAETGRLLSWHQARKPLLFWSKSLRLCFVSV